MGNEPTLPDVNQFRIKYAFWLAIIGLSIAALLVAAPVFKADYKSSDVAAAVVGLFTSVPGTLVGAFFGLQIGSACNVAAR